MTLKKKQEGTVGGPALLTINDVSHNEYGLVIHTDKIDFPIRVENKIVKTKNKEKSLFVNEYGRFYWAESKDKLPKHFLTESTRLAFQGEAMLVDLIINANDMQGEQDFMIDASRLCRHRDPTEIKSFVVDTQVVAYISMYGGQEVVAREFLPADCYPQFSNGIPQTDQVKNWLKKVNY